MIVRRSQILFGQKSLFEYGQKQPVPSGQRELIVAPAVIETTVRTDAPFRNWDTTYTKILYCIRDNYTISKMAKQLHLPRSTLVGRLRKLVEKEIITETESVILGIRQKTFIITSGWAMKLLCNGEAQVVVSKPFKPPLKPDAVKFTKHAVSLQAEILEGAIPKGDRSYSPNGWTGQIFEGNGTYSIRVIPNKKGIGRAVIDINLSLSASSSADLTMKYHALAERYLGKWSEQYNIKLGQITEYKKPHTVIEGSRELAQTIIKLTGGESRLENYGVQVDESDKEHKGEAEFHGEKGEKSLRNFEFALNQAPERMEQLESKFDTLRENLHQEVKKVGRGITEVQGWLILQRENDLLREQNLMLKEQMEELKKQVNEMKSTLGLSPATQTRKSKWDDVGIYG
jgi:DNA-binding Lrp family transcriptional regulator